MCKKYKIVIEDPDHPECGEEITVSKREFRAIKSYEKADLITKLFLLAKDMSTKKERHDRQLTATKIKKLFKEAQEKLEDGELAAFSDAYHNLNCQYNSYFLQEAREIDESPITAEMITAYREDLVDAEQRLWGGWMEAHMAAQILEIRCQVLEHNIRRGRRRRRAITNLGIAGSIRYITYNGAHYRACSAPDGDCTENDGNGDCIYISMLQIAGRAASSENILALRRQVAERLTDTQIRTCLQLMHFENNVQLFIGRRLRTILEGEEPVLESSSSKKKASKRKVEVTIKEPVDSLSRGVLSKREGYWHCDCPGAIEDFISLDIEHCDTCDVWRPRVRRTALLERSTTLPSYKALSSKALKVKGKPSPLPELPRWPSRVSMPTIKAWKERTAGEKLSIRARSSIGKVDKVLNAWWVTFRSYDKEGTLKQLERLEKELRFYKSFQINKRFGLRFFKKEPSSRLEGVKWLLARLPIIHNEISAWDHPKSPCTKRPKKKRTKSENTLAQRLGSAYGEDGKQFRSLIAAAQLYLVNGHLDESPVDFFFETAEGSESALALVAATTDAILQNLNNGGDPMSFLTTSDWTLGPECILGLLTLAQTFRALVSGELTGSPSEVAATLLQAGGSVTVSGATMANAIANLAYGAEGAKAISSTAQQVAAPAAIVAGLATMYLDSRELDRLAVQSQTLSQRKAFIYAADRRTFAEMSLVPEIAFLMKELEKKLGSLKLRSEASRVGSAVSVASGSFTAITVFGLANCWNPAGWALVGAGALAAIISLGYRPSRYFYKKGKLKEMRKKNGRIPDHLKTTGDWNRFRLADLMVRGALLDPSLSETEQTAGQALCWIVFGGKNYKTACLAAITLGYPGIMTMLKEAKLPID